MIKIEGDKLSSIINIDDALPEQIEYGEENETFIEEWFDIEIHQFNNIAIVKANYSLTVDNEKREGIDILTLHRDKEGWHILNLIYEQTALIDL